MASVSAMFIIILSPLTTTLALISPPLYALVAGAHGIGFCLAIRWTRTPGSALLTALLTGLLAAPLSALGFLLVIALVTPAAALEISLKAGSTRAHQLRVWYIGAAAAGLAIFALSLLIIDAAVLTPLVFWLTLVCRLVSYLVVGWVVLKLEGALVLAGVRRRVR